jgi:Family of unknown function (DUF6308)
MILPEILDEVHVVEAAALVTEYYTNTYKRGEIRTGARFEGWAGGGDNSETANTITADDLIAVTFLSVDVPAPAAIGILETHRDEISDLLAQIPADLDLADVTDARFNTLLGRGSAASQLWSVLRRTPEDRWGIGQTTASKIMARKRPWLIPIYDSVVRPLMGIKDSSSQWTAWYSALRSGAGLPGRLAQIRKASGVAPNASALRIMDVVLWKHGKDIAAGQQRLARTAV